MGCACINVFSSTPVPMSVLMKQVLYACCGSVRRRLEQAVPAGCAMSCMFIASVIWGLCMYFFQRFVLARLCILVLLLCSSKRMSIHQVYLEILRP